MIAVASSERGRRLTQQHRAKQLSVRAVFLQELLQTFDLLDVRNLGATTERWLAATVPLVGRHWVRSALASATYLALFRAAETGKPGRDPVAPKFPADKARAVAASLAVTGPVQIRNLTKAGRPLERALSTAKSTVSGSAGRHVLDGGRAVLLDPVISGQAEVRYARITDADACWFCAMMASRGYVYYDDDTAGGDANARFVGEGLFKFHDYCSCTVEPTFDPGGPLPEVNAKFADLWVASTRTLGGVEARKAFRRAVEGRSLPTDPISAAA